MSGKSHAHGISRSDPSMFQVNPWNGQRSWRTCPGLVRSWVPRCRQELWKAWISVSVVRRTMSDASPIS